MWSITNCQVGETAEKHIPTCGFYIINNDRSSCYELYNSTSDAFRFWTNSCVCGYNLDVELLNPTSFSSSLWFSPSFLPFTRFSCWTSSPPFSFRSPSSIYDLYPSSKFLNPDSSSFSISIFISSGVPLWSVLPRPRVFYFSLRSPPLHPSIFPSLPLFPHPLTISSPDRPQTSLVSFKEISPGKKNTWRSQLPFPYKTPVKAITYNSWIFFFWNSLLSTWRVISRQGTWRSWQIFPKQGSRGSLLWSLRWRTLGTFGVVGSVCHVVKTQKLMWLLCGFLRQWEMFRSGQKQIHKPSPCLSVGSSQHEINIYMSGLMRTNWALNKSFLNEHSFTWFKSGSLNLSWSCPFQS